MSLLHRRVEICGYSYSRIFVLNDQVRCGVGGAGVVIRDSDHGALVVK